VVSVSGKQNITAFQLPPAEGSELKTHPNLQCSGWKPMEKSSHARILKKKQNSQKTNNKNPLNVSQGFSECKTLQFKNWTRTPAQGPFGPLQTFPPFDSARGFLRSSGDQNQVLVQVRPDQVPPTCFILTARAR